MLRTAGYTLALGVAIAAIVVTSKPETQDTLALDQVYHAYYVSTAEADAGQISQVKNPFGGGLNVSFGNFNGKGNSQGNGGGTNKSGSFPSLTKPPITSPMPPSTLTPATLKPATFKPVTLKPTTLTPVTLKPVTLKPVTLKPTTLTPVTLKPVTLKPTTLTPVTLKPVTLKPTTLTPVTLKPVTLKPTTLTPVTLKPITLKPTKLTPVTLKPITLKPTKLTPVTLKPVTIKPTGVVTIKPVTIKPIGIVTLKPITIKCPPTYPCPPIHPCPPIYPCPPITCWLPGCGPSVVVVPGGGPQVVVVEEGPVPVTEKLMKLHENQVVTFGGKELGEQAGQIQLKYGEIALTPELKDWKNDRFTMIVPEMGLQAAAEFEMFVINVNGEVKNALRVQIVPGEPAADAMPDASVMEGDMASLGGQLGEQPGKIELRIGELRLAMEIKEWTAEFCKFMVPTLGLSEPVAARMVLTNAAGKEVQALDVSITPATDKVANDG